MSRGLSQWFPLSERGKANGVMFFGSRVGGMLSVPDRAAADRPLGLARELRHRSARSAWCGRRRGSRGTAIARPSTRRSRASELAWIEQDKVGQGGRAWTGRPGGPVGTPWRALLTEPESVRDLRDVLHVRLRPLLLLHVAADVSHSRAGILRAERRAAGRAAVSLRGPGGPRGRVAHRRAGAQPGLARRHGAASASDRS